MQTAYKTKFNQFLLGMLTPASTDEVITLIPTEVLQYGRAVKRAGTDGLSVSNIAVDGTTDKVVGITVIKHNELGEYSIGEEASIVTKGSIAVKVLSTDTVKAGDSAYMIVATTNFGDFTKTAGSNTVACGVFQSVKDNGLAVVKIDIVA